MPGPSSLSYAITHPNAGRTPTPIPTESTASPTEPRDFWGEDGFTFGDLLDVINPLQHIPVVSSLYRKVTGDDISPGARIFGGGLFGGPIGLFAAAFDNAVGEMSGKNMGEHLIAALEGPGESAAPTPVQTAAVPSSEVPQQFAADTSATDNTNQTIEAPIAVGGTIYPVRLDILLRTAYGQPHDADREPVDNALRELAKALDLYEISSRLGELPDNAPAAVDAPF